MRAIIIAARRKPLSGNGHQRPAQAEPARPPITSVSHLAVYASDAAKTERFYVHDLGAVKRPDPENPPGVRLLFFSHASSSKCCRCRPNAGANRIDHIAFNTANAEAHAPISGVQEHRGARRR